MITAAVFLAQTGTARGDINRFTSPQRLVGYLGLDPRVRQSGNGPGHTGRISKEGAAAVRHVLVESALTAIRSPGPLRAFYHRVRARRGHPIAIVATARKMAKLFWHLLVREQDYAYTLPTALAKKIRTIELKAGHPRQPAGGNRHTINREQRRALERQIAEHAQSRLRADDRRLASATPRQTSPNTGEDLTFIRPFAISFSAAISSDWSATIRFNRAFSTSSSFRRLTSSAFIPPNCARHR